MKKNFNRSLSVVLAFVMMLSVVIAPSAVTLVTQSTAADAPESVGKDNTGITIDFDYAEKYGVTTPKDAKAIAAAYETHKATSSDQVKWNKICTDRDREVWDKAVKHAVDNRNDYEGSAEMVGDGLRDWSGDRIDKKRKKKFGYIEERYSYNCTREDWNPLRKKLESTDPDDKYIKLMGDHYYQNLLNCPTPIMITEDKVLDLNGHEIILNDQNNINYKKPTQYNDNPAVHQSYMFDVGTKANGKPATLTIIDSSGDNSGRVYNNAYMVDPFDSAYKNFTTRDIFYLNGGNLVVYGGTYQAGRSKDQRESSFTWENFKKVVGKVVSLGVTVAEYINGIDIAKAGVKDLKESFKNAELQDTSKDKSFKDTQNGSTNESKSDSTEKKNGIDGAVDEIKKNNPQMKKGRNQTIKEKNDDNNEKIKQENNDTGSEKPTEPENKANEKGTGKQENEKGKKVEGEGEKPGKEVSLVNAEKKITDAYLDSNKINGILDGAFDLFESIGKIFNNKSPIICQTFLGTVVKVGRGSTFVSYGGNYIGYGSTPNTRNAVVEVFEDLGSPNVKFNNNPELDKKYNGGLAYIYGGDFTANTGSNIFNVVKSQTGELEVYQAEKTSSGGKAEKVKIHQSELNGVEPITLYKDKPVNTRNITVRGGTFNCNYEALMLGLKDENKKVTTFPGTPGTVNIGMESYGETFIQDGRIQICDPYGEGEMVMMDDIRDENEGLHHYRLFCSDLELRNKYHLRVYPGSPDTNTTHSFRLFSTHGANANESVRTLSFNDDELGSERSSAYGDDEQYFEYPVNPNGLTKRSTSAHYYIKPSSEETMSNDVYGKNFKTSKMWYYPMPVDAKGNTIDNFTYYNMNGDQFSTSNYLSDLKWFRYKVYRVDPLTRENLTEGTKFGQDVPLADIVYGGSSDSLKCKLPLYDLEQYMKNKWKDTGHFDGYKPGEMYRVEFTVDEYLSYNIKSDGKTYKNNLKDAAMTSSIIFTCYDEQEETKRVAGQTTKVPDYTPLQWKTTPEAGQTAEVQIMNGKAGQADINGNKIFDVYYQWYEVDKNGKEKLIAGTTDIYRGSDPAEQKLHTVANIDETTANTKNGYSYVNTMTPTQQRSGLYNKYGLPKNIDDWDCSFFHAYSFMFMGDTMIDGLFSNPSNKSPSTNFKHIFDTNSDTCYIPESMSGKDIICRATVVNVYWPLNYDHVQVFETHKMHIGAADCSVLVEGRGGYDEYTVKYGDKFTLPDCDFENPYSSTATEFDKWNLGKPGDQIVITGETRIKALWKEPTINIDNSPRVEICEDSESGNKKTVQVSKGSIFTLPECKTKKEDALFCCWHVEYPGDKNKSDTIAEPGDTIKVNGYVTCTATWSDYFWLYYTDSPDHLNEEYGRIIKKVRMGDTVTLPGLPSEYRRNVNGQIANSWNVGSPNTKYVIDNKLKMRNNIAYIYPDYREEAEYTITYDANGGKFTDAFGGGTTYSVQMPEAEADKKYYRLITDSGLYRNGYEFDGWSVGAPGDWIKITGSVTITAKWKAIPSPAPNWHPEFNESTGTLTIKGTGIISADDGSYSTGITFPHSSYVKHLVFSEGITEISRIWDVDNSIQDVTFPSTLEKIGPNVFGFMGRGLPSVKSIDIPAKCKTIGVAAFSRCYDLETVTLHEGLENIGKDCFSGCESLTTLTIPNSVKRIGKGAFGSNGERYFCDTQELIDGIIASKSDEFIEDLKLNVTKGSAAEEYAIKFGFNYDNGEAKPTPVTNDKISYTVDKAAGTITITGSGAIPDYNYYNAPWAKAKADYDCHKLIISEGITSIGKYAFAGMCLLEVQFPSTLKKIDDYAFIGCDVLGAMDGITFPDSLESIGTAAFRFVGAKTINFGKGVKSIGDYAFCDRYVYNLEIGTTTAGKQYYHTVPGSHYAYEVEIPDNVETIGDYAFGYYNTYTFDWRYDPYSDEAPLSNLGGKDGQGHIMNLTIVTPKGSAAYDYALANGFYTSTTGVVKYLLVGDVNRDGIVSSSDIARFNSYFSMYVESGVASYNLDVETADINSDGAITEADRDLLHECLEDADKYAQYIKPIRVIQ